MSLAPNDPATETPRRSPSSPGGERSKGARARCIVILGMHRSGTSALTRVVNLLGAGLSRELIPPKPSNVTGFWESQSIFEIHNELLKAFGLMWQDYLPLPGNWEATEAAAEAKARLVDYLRSEFSDSPLFTVKDPRICRLLSLWPDALKEIDAEPLFLFCYRSPLEVAASLYSRDELPRETSLRLWMRSYAEGEAATRDFQRLFISYDDLMRDWRPVLKRITEGFALDWPRSPEDAAAEIDAFLSEGHRHHEDEDFSRVEDPTLRDLVRRMYEALRNDPEGTGDGLRSLNAPVTGYLDQQSEIFGPALKYEHRAQFRLQTDKARAHRYIRRLEEKIKEHKRKSRQRKQRAKLILALAVLAAAALGFAGGAWLASGKTTPTSEASPGDNAGS